MTTQKHHPCSPSVLYRRELCPGSMRMEQDLPDIPNDASIRGIMMHDIVSKKILNPYFCIEPGISADDSELVQDMIRFHESRLHLTEGEKTFVEEYLDYKKNNDVLFFGTCDVLILHPNTECAILIDWKTGRTPVDEAEDNCQGAAYAIAAMQRYKLLFCTVIFFNPTIHQKTEYTFENSDALRWNIEKIIERANDPDAPCIPGEKQCLYCKAALHGTCPAFRGIATELYEVAKRQPLEMISTMPDSTLVDVVEKGKLISKFSDAAEKELKERCEKHGEVCGYFLKEVSGGREADDLKGLWGMLKPELNQDDFLSCCKVSIPSLEKAFIKASGSTVKLGKERFADLTADCITEKPARKMLAKVKGEK